MNRNFLAKGILLFLGLTLLLVLAACGKTVESMKADGDIRGLISILGDPQEELGTRTQAAIALGEIGDRSAVEPLIQYMQECATIQDTKGLSTKVYSDADQACHKVSEILGKMGDTKATDPLIGLLDNKWVHNDVVQTLGKLNDPRAVVPLIDTLDHGLSKFTDMQDRNHLHRDAVLALVANATPNTFEELSQALPNFYAEEEHCYKYGLAIEALIAMQDPRIETILLSELKTYDGYCKNNLLPNTIAEFYNNDPVKLLPFLKSDQTGVFARTIAEFYNNDPVKLLPFLKSDQTGELAKKYFSSTPKPEPMEVDFVSLRDYPINTQVTITGRVVLPDILVMCSPDCSVEFRSPSKVPGGCDIFLHRLSQMADLPAHYKEKDFKVFLSNGKSVGNNSLIRITGTICSLYTICDITKIEAAK